MKITVITAFPDFLRSFLSTSIIGRAVKRGILNVNIVDLRDFSEGNYHQIDDYSFGGNGGMTIMPEVLERALNSIKEDESKVLFPTPVGTVLTQDLVESLATEKNLVIICGHYEGLDERFVEKCVDLEYSIGDYVLTGGEIPAMTLIDALSRLVPGVVGKTLSVTDDSFYNGMLDTPHYTRPADWGGMKVPLELLSGNDAQIEKWRKRSAVARTLSRRPDLLSRASAINYLEDEAYLGIVADPSDHNLSEDLSQILLSAKSYGILRTIVMPGKRELFNLLRDKLSILPDAKCVPSLGSMIEWVVRKKHGTLNIVACEAQGGVPWLEAKRRLLEASGPVLIFFGESPKTLIKGSKIVKMRPVETIGGEMPRTALISITLDRFFGFR